MSEFNEDYDGMMISEQNQSDNGWTFLVELGQGDSILEYLVEVDRDYWARLTDKRTEPLELVRAAFKFLLEKETKELILRKFNIADISGHFPNFENEIKRML